MRKIILYLLFAVVSMLASFPVNAQQTDAAKDNAELQAKWILHLKGLVN